MKFFSLIYQGDVRPAADEKVIPAEEYSKILEAYAIIEKAKEDAKTLLDKTKKECALLKEKAKQEGIEEGLEQYNLQILKMDQELKKLRHELQRMVLPIALKAAKKIVGKELSIFPETIVDIVLQALTPISQSHKVIIFVNKQDKELLESHKPQLLEMLKQVETLSIQEKSGISPGGCIIQTEAGLINATIENQWAALEKAFEKYFKPA
jgi:type III secretion protein L